MHRAALLAATVAVVCAACAGGSSTSLDASSDSSEPEAPTETTTADDPTTSSGPPGASSVSTETSSASSVTTAESTLSACPTSELPAGDSTAPSTVELDGDGVADTAYMVRNASGWQLVIEVGGGGAVVSGLVGTNDFDRPTVLGAADLDGDGLDELVVLVANGAYVGLVSFVRFRDCTAVQLAFADDSPAIFASGASAGGGEALVCNGNGTIDRYFFSWLPGDGDTVEYEAGFEPFRIEGDVVVSLPGAGTGLTEDEITDLDLFDCLGLELVQ